MYVPRSEKLRWCVPEVQDIQKGGKRLSQLRCLSYQHVGAVARSQLRYCEGAPICFSSTECGGARRKCAEELQMVVACCFQPSHTGVADGAELFRFPLGEQSSLWLTYRMHDHLRGEGRCAVSGFL